MNDEVPEQPAEQRKVLWYTEPMLHFIGVGLLTFLLIPTENESVPPIIEEGKESIERRVQARLAETLNREPTEAEWAKAVAWETDRSHLLDEAIRLGLHRDHPEIEKLLFEQIEDIIGDVIPEPSEKDLRSWYEEEGQKRRERRLGFTQLFLPANTPDSEVKEVLGMLVGGAEPESVGARIGKVQSAREGSLSKMLPATVVSHVLTKPTLQWQRVEGMAPPLIVRIDERVELKPKSFDSVRERVRSEWRANKKHEVLREWIQKKRGDLSDSVR